MKNRKFPSTFLVMAPVIFMILILSLGCLPVTGGSVTSTGTSTDSEDDEPTSLATSDNGGYDDSDESPYFGLSAMEQYIADDETDDPTVTEEEAEEEEGEEGAQVYVVQIIWGNLELNSYDDRERDDTDSDWIDWTGALSFSGEGVLLLRRTILFDRHDSITDEDDPLRIEWDSHTGPHIDGLLAELVYVPSEEGEAPSLTFETDPVTQSISLDELDRYNEIVTIDEDGHGAAFTALRVDDNNCEEGFLHGKFHDRPNGGEEGGIFRGRYLSEFGDLQGHLRGHYGVNDGEDKVFFGKYISETGRFRGFLEGNYGDGAFDGVWHDGTGTTEGTLNGKYVTGEEVDSGFFQGYWMEMCD